MGYEISFLGLLVSLVFVSLTGIYPGGIIVPSYLYLFAEQPLRICGTLGAALLTLFCFKLLSRYLILFGRRRFIFMILVGGIWTFLWIKLFPQIIPASVEFKVIGWVIPGLIANNFERQGVIVTASSIITVTVIIYFIGRLYFQFI